MATNAVDVEWKNFMKHKLKQFEHNKLVATQELTQQEPAAPKAPVVPLAKEIPNEV